MREELQPGNKFPDIELPNQDKEVEKLSNLMRGFPAVVVFSRGYYCPKDRRQLANYVAYLQPELIVNYCKLVVVSVDDPMLTKEVKDGLGATFPFFAIRRSKSLTNSTSLIRPTRTTARWRFLTLSCLIGVAPSIRFIMAGGTPGVRQSRNCEWTIALCSQVDRIGGMTKRRRPMPKHITQKQIQIS
jgi:peroxiredoxin